MESKYKKGEVVEFEHLDKKLIGRVIIIDWIPNEGFRYDVMVDESNTLYKHINENMLKKPHKAKNRLKQAQINDLKRKAELKEEFRKLTKLGVKFAKKKGIKTLNDVVRIIHEGRKIR